MPEAHRSGPTRPPLTKYYRGGEPQGSSPFEKKQPKVGWRKKLIKFGDGLVLIIIVAGLLYSLVVNPHPSVILNSQVYHPASIYQAEAQSLMQGLKNRNKLSFDGSAISSKIQSKFPEIASAYVELPVVGQKPVVHLNVSPPSLRLVSGQRFLVDEQGVVISLASEVKGSGSLPLLVDQSGFKNQIGKAVLSQSSIAFINQLIKQSKQSQIPIDQLSLPNAAQELDLKTPDQPYIVKFYLGGNASQQIGQFLAARHKFIANGSPPGSYLDVRVPGKVFYK